MISRICVSVVKQSEFPRNPYNFDEISKITIFPIHIYSSADKVEIYYPKPPCTRCETSHSPGKDSLLVKVSDEGNETKNKKQYFVYISFSTLIVVLFLSSIG